MMRGVITHLDVGAAQRTVPIRQAGRFHPGCIRSCQATLRLSNPIWFGSCCSTPGMGRNWVAISILVLGVAGFSGLRYYQRAYAETSGRVAARIEHDLQRHVMPADAPWRDRRTMALARAFYQHRHMRPAWVSGPSASNDARELSEMLLQADREGLDPADYSAPELAAHWNEHRKGSLIGTDPAALAQFDLLCTLSALRYMSDVSDGRISPRALDAQWVAQPRRGDLDSLLDANVRRHRVRAMLVELAPTQPGYVRLRDARARCAQMVADGKLPAERLRQVELNMERWRWLPRSFGDRYVLVDIPEYALHVMEGGREVLGMRVVVGKVMTATPVFSDRIADVVINPTWNIPVSIAQRELADSIRDDPGYLDRRHIRIFDKDAADASEVDPTRVNWSDSDEVAHLHLRQDSGPDNALGRIKFVLPNRFDVYLHDTPVGQLFSLKDRSFSHGCVRVQDAMALALYVLQGSPQDSRDALQQLIDTGQTKWIKVPDPLPVHIVYFTAYVDDRGALAFRDDVYGIDANQIEQLESHGRAPGAVTRT
jgi:murein L,D-transpeptidase YcbB/YkuD